MGTWRALALGDGVIATPMCENLKQQFAQTFSSASEHPYAAIFKRQDSESSLHCEVTAYFSPDAESVAIAFGATPCARPIRAGLELLAGDKQCWAVLFCS